MNEAHFKRMYHALKTIAKDYKTPDQLRKSCQYSYGLGYHESLEMAYENIQQLAKEATKGVRIPKQEVKEEPDNTQSPNSK